MTESGTSATGRDAREDEFVVQEAFAVSVRAMTESARYRSALDAIAGPSWGDGPEPWVSHYRAAGGGYEGLQAIAKAALSWEKP